MPSPGVSSPFDPRPRVTPPKQLAIKISPFDQHHYQKLIRAREETIRNVLQRLSPAVGLTTALDAGAGVGFFSQTLADCGLSVSGFDGRAENVAEARKRFPHIAFEQADVQHPSIMALGKFDLVLCFGLLYHPGKSFVGDTAPSMGESSRRRGIEILKSMIRVRTANAKIGGPPAL
jgi:SAM-dependent methyltransferase